MFPELHPARPPRRRSRARSAISGERRKRNVPRLRPHRPIRPALPAAPCAAAAADRIERAVEDLAAVRASSSLPVAKGASPSAVPQSARSHSGPSRTSLLRIATSSVALSRNAAIYRRREARGSFQTGSRCAPAVRALSGDLSVEPLSTTMVSATRSVCACRSSRTCSSRPRAVPVRDYRGA